MGADTNHPAFTMPNIEDRLPQNAPGRFYVDSSCIDCDMCRGIAPDFFRRDDDIGQTIVFRQPVTDTDIQLCLEALVSCPTESIGQMEESVPIP